MPTPPTPTLWALLIGIDVYQEAAIAGLPEYGSLSGCVNDISLMENFLRTRLNLPAERVTKLTASGWGSEPQEPRQNWPTKANIVAAFRRLAQAAQPGDQVYIHYSGHGGRALTIFPEVKGQGMGVYDESLVPTDYGQIENKQQPEDRYLRDLELAHLLRELEKRGLIVTVVLDSCHSDGANRGEASKRGVRGGLRPDMVRRTPSDLVASPQALMACWQPPVRATRAASASSGWLPGAASYTLLAACQALELANETTAPNGNVHGALSYALWQALQTPDLNWETVYQQIRATVRGQTPQLQGTGDRAVFGGALSLATAASVMEASGDQVRLEIGQSGGAAVGAQYTVYRLGATDFGQIGQQVAVVELTKVLETESWARVVRRLNDASIELGAQARLFDPGASRRRGVRLLRAGQGAFAGEDAALARLSATIAQRGSPFLRLSDSQATFQVGVSKDGAYEIRDANGQPLPHLTPVPIDQPGEIAYRLEHLARYYNAKDIDNPISGSRLAGKLEVKLMRTPDQAFDAAGGAPTVKENDQIYYLFIRNGFEALDEPPNDDEFIDEIRKRTLHITVLNLAPDWSIQRLIPGPRDAQKQFELGPGQTLMTPQRGEQGLAFGLPRFRSTIPRGGQEAVDTIKVFATLEPANFDALRLAPVLDLGSRTRGRTRASSADRDLPEPDPSWMTTQVHVRVVK